MGKQAYALVNGIWESIGGTLTSIVQPEPPDPTGLPDGTMWVDSDSTGNSSSGALDDLYVNIDGDTMTGSLTVPSLSAGDDSGLGPASIRMIPGGEGFPSNVTINSAVNEAAQIEFHADATPIWRIGRDNDGNNTFELANQWGDPVFRVDYDTRLMTVADNPVTDLGVATKAYVDAHSVGGTTKTIYGKITANSSQAVETTYTKVIPQSYGYDATTLVTWDATNLAFLFPVDGWCLLTWKARVSSITSDSIFYVNATSYGSPLSADQQSVFMPANTSLIVNGSIHLEIGAGEPIGIAVKSTVARTMDKFIFVMTKV